MLCGATPDGRKARAPLSDSCSPAQGTDISGPTATVKSVANLEHINLAQTPEFEKIKVRLAKHFPKKNADPVKKAKN